MVRLRSAFSKYWQAMLNHKGWRETNMRLQFAGSELEYVILATEPLKHNLGYVFRPAQWYDIVITYDAGARASLA